MTHIRKRAGTLLAILLLGGLFLSPIPDGVGVWVSGLLTKRAHESWRFELDAAKEAEGSGNLDLAEEHLLASYRMAADRTIPPNADSCLSAYALGGFYRRHSDDKRAAEFFDLARRESGVVFGWKSLEVAKTLRRLVDVLHDLAIHVEELRYAEEELAIRETLSAEAPDLVQSLRNIGRAQRETGAYRAAQSSFERAERLQQSVVKTAINSKQANLDLAVIQGMCGISAFHAGEFRQAQRWFERAVPSLKSIRTLAPKLIEDFEQAQLRTIEILAKEGKKLRRPADRSGNPVSVRQRTTRTGG